MAKIKKNLIEIFVLIGIVLLFFFSTDPVIYPDSNRYLMGSIYDPPLYSTFVKMINLLFGDLNYVIVFQTILIGISIVCLTKTLAIYLDLDIKIKTIISIFLFLPIIQFYNNLLTEPLSYALSLFFINFAIRLIYNFNNKYLILVSIFAITLLLTRHQFMFLYPVILILYLGIFIIKNFQTKSLILSFFIIIFLHNTLININSKIRKDDYKKYNFKNDYTGIFFFTYIDAIYISSNKDIKLFNDKKLQNALKLIFLEMDKRKSLIKYYDGRGHFGSSFKNIRNYSKSVFGDIYTNKKDLVIMKRDVSIKLIKKNIVKYVKHIFKKSYDSAWIFIFVPLCILIPALFVFIKNKSYFSLLSIFLTTFVLINHTTIYLFGRVQPRYFIYTDFILLIFIFIIFFQSLKKKIIFK